MPPPPPREAQKMSGSLSMFAVCTAPSAVTSWSSVSWSHASPNDRTSTPTPPPSVSPVTPTVAHEPPAIAGESAAFMMMNRNKRGIALDLKHQSGKAVLSRLLADADVLIENYRSDTMAKL